MSDRDAFHRLDSRVVAGEAVRGVLREGRVARLDLLGRLSLERHHRGRYTHHVHHSANK